MKKILIGIIAVFIGLMLVFTGWYLLTAPARKAEADKQKAFEDNFYLHQQKIDEANQHTKDYCKQYGREDEYQEKGSC